MSKDYLGTCDNCGCIVKTHRRSCHLCGYEFPQYKMSDSSQYSTQYTYHIAEESDGNEDDNYVLSEVELKPPSVGDLLKTYSETLEQLKAEKCVFFSVMFNPKNWKTVTNYVGFPDDAIKSLKETADRYIPKPTLEKRYLRWQKNMSEAERQALPYGCSYPGCGYRTKYNWHIKHHMRTHTGEKPYACDRCDFTCSDPSHMPSHKRRHENVTDYQCTVCHTYWDHQKGLDSHITFSHKSLRGVHSNICATCGKNFPSLTSLVRHKKIHHSQVKIKCDVAGCFYESKFYQVITKHKKFHHEGCYEGNKFPCPKCAFRSNTTMGINVHIKKCHQSAVHKAESEAAGTSTPKSNSQIVVSKKKTSTDKPKTWQCYYCDNIEQSWDKYHKHLKTHDQKNEKILIRSVIIDGVEKFYCARCKSNKNERREAIEEHVVRCQQRFHSSQARRRTEKRYCCVLCDYSSQSVSPLQSHYALLHENCPVAYKCHKPNCGEVFTQLADLKSHRTTGHQNRSKLSKPSSALTSQARPGNWLLHWKNHKFGLKCDQCPFSAATEQKLNFHKSFHSGEAFQCSWCGLVFYDNKQFRIHETGHKRDDQLMNRSPQRILQGQLPTSGVQCLSLANQSAEAIKNKYRGFKILSFVSPQQIGEAIPAVQQVTQKDNVPSPSITSSTINVGLEADMNLKAATIFDDDDVDTSSVPAESTTHAGNSSNISTMVYVPAIVPAADQITGNQVPAAIVYKPLNKVMTTDNRDSVTPESDKRYVNTADLNPHIDIPGFRKIRPVSDCESESTTKTLSVGVPKLTPSDKRVVRNRVADLVNRSGTQKPDIDDMQVKCSKTQQTAPKLTKLLDSNNKIKIKKLDASGQSVVKKGKKMNINKAADDEVTAFLKQVNRPSTGSQPLINVNVKDLMKSLNVKPGSRILLQKAQGRTLVTTPNESQLNMSTIPATATAGGGKRTVTLAARTKRLANDTNLGDSSSEVLVRKKPKLTPEGPIMSQSKRIPPGFVIQTKTPDKLSIKTVKGTPKTITMSLYDPVKSFPPSDNFIAKKAKEDDGHSSKSTTTAESVKAAEQTDTGFYAGFYTH